MFCSRRPKAILVPYPAQGHVTPMFKLATLLHSSGFDPMLVTPEHIHHRIALKLNQTEKITCIPIPDGLDLDAPRDFFVIEKVMEDDMPLHLEQLVSELNVDNSVSLMVVDLLASFAIEVGNRCRIPTVGLWPAMLSTYNLVAAIPVMIRAGLISDSGLPEQDGELLHLPNNLPSLTTQDLPWLIGSVNARKARFKFWNRAINRSKALPWLFVNSFLEENNQQQQQIRRCSQDCALILPIAPLNNLSPLTGNASLWEEDTGCLLWLSQQEPSSVIYVSFGSWVSPIGRDNIESLALSLESTTRPFLWVLSSTWRESLPMGYCERVKGKVVYWAPQMEILRHSAIGFYLTHCGWNSTMEAIQCEKPLLCYPVAGDQFVNCKYIVEVWKIGVRMSGFGQKELEDSLRQVMADGEMGIRLAKLRERTMGQEVQSKVMANLRGFFNDLIQMTNGLNSTSHQWNLNYSQSDTEWTRI